MLYPFGQSTSPQFDTVTDANGRFTMQIPIAKPGAWQVVVAWDGDANHLGFSQTVTIEAEWNYTPYIIELLLVLLSATLIVYKTRKRILTKSGKTPLSASSIQETSRTREITEKARKARELLDSQLITKDEFDLLMKDERDHD